MNELEQAHDRFATVTPREMQIIQELSNGLSTREVSEKLGISFKTTENHRHSIMKKTGLKNTTHICCTWLRDKVIS